MPANPAMAGGRRNGRKLRAIAHFRAPAPKAGEPKGPLRKAENAGVGRDREFGNNAGGAVVGHVSQSQPRRISGRSGDVGAVEAIHVRAVGQRVPASIDDRAGCAAPATPAMPTISPPTTETETSSRIIDIVFDKRKAARDEPLAAAAPQIAAMDGNSALADHQMCDRRRVELLGRAAMDDAAAAQDRHPIGAADDFTDPVRDQSRRRRLRPPDRAHTV